MRAYFRGKTVAVVGNGFSPRDVSAKVDSSDIVIRFNLDPARLLYGYTQVKPQVPTGVKTHVMAGFWNRMKLPRLLRLSPGVQLLMTLRPNSTRSMKNYKRAGLYETRLPTYIVTPQQHARVRGYCGAPVLCGMSALFILAQYNTAQSVTFYNFNFYAPALNKGVPDYEKVYKRCIGGKKGKRTYGYPGHPKKHKLSKSYRWFKRTIGNLANFHWDATRDEVRAIERFLL
jgi:hypothetical protein